MKKTVNFNTMKSVSKMSSLHNDTNDDLIHTDCHYKLSTTSTTPHHQSMNNQRTNIQTHSIATAKHPTKCISNDKSVVARGRRTLDKSSDFLRWNKTKSKACHHHHRNHHHNRHWRMSHRIFLVITIVLFASLNEVLICVAHAGDVTSLIRVSDDDERSNNQKYSNSGITSDPLVRDGGGAGGASRNNPALYNLDKFGSNLEMSIAAVFNKVAYGTTTKRSISDNVFVPNLTTVPTPQLTTFR